MNLSTMFCRHAVSALLAAILFSLPFAVAAGDYSDLLEIARKAGKDRKNAPWRRCDQEIQTRYKPGRYVGFDGPKEGPPIYVVFAGQEAFRFGTTYYLIATRADGDRMRFACSLTESGDIWDLVQLD